MGWQIPIIDSLVKGVGNYFTDKQQFKADEKIRRDEILLAKQTAKLEAVRRGDHIESDYDLLVLEASKSTWIDEVMIIWMLSVVSSLFIPSLAPYAIAGFAGLEAAPLWFSTVFVGCFISKLGLRFLFSGRTLFGKVVK